MINRVIMAAVGFGAGGLAYLAVGGEPMSTFTFIGVCAVGVVAAALWWCFGWETLDDLLERGGPGTYRAIYWVGFAVGGALILAVAAAITWDGATKKPSEPGYVFPDGTKAIKRGRGVYEVYGYGGRYIGRLYRESDGSLGVYDDSGRLVKRWDPATKVR